MTAEPPDSTAPRRGWVLYDGDCGFCRRWATLCASTLRRNGYTPAPLQASWVRPRLSCDPDDLLADLRLLRADGSQVRGSAVYLEVMRHIWWTWPLSRLFRLPGLHHLFDWTYRTVAAHRSHLSSACGLDSSKPPPSPDDSDFPAG